jgi:predicted dinucleotide-utilizing enzyme
MLIRDQIVCANMTRIVEGASQTVRNYAVMASIGGIVSTCRTFSHADRVHEHSVDIQRGHVVDIARRVDVEEEGRTKNLLGTLLKEQIQLLYAGHATTAAEWFPENLGVNPQVCLEVTAQGIP